MKITSDSQLKKGEKYWHVSAPNGATLIFKASNADVFGEHNFEGNIVFDNEEEAQQMADSLNQLLSPHLFHESLIKKYLDI